MSRLDEIEARLKAATPGPWHFVRAGGITAGIEWIAQVFNRRDEDFPNAANNAALIASAPADIAALLPVARIAEKIAAADSLSQLLDWQDELDAALTALESEARQ